MNQTVAHFFWKNFNSKFKKKCIEEVEKPVQKILEELKLKFTNELDGRDRELFIKRLPTTKSHLMQGYCARGPQYDSLPKTLNNVGISSLYQKQLMARTLIAGKRI